MKRCWAWASVIVVIGSWAASACGAIEPSPAGLLSTLFPGRLEQGGLALGRVEPHSQVVYQGRHIHVSPAGLVILGIDATASSPLTLTIIAAGQPAHKSSGSRSAPATGPLKRFPGYHLLWPHRLLAQQGGSRTSARLFSTRVNAMMNGWIGSVLFFYRSTVQSADSSAHNAVTMGWRGHPIPVLTSPLQLEQR